MGEVWGDLNFISVWVHFVEPVEPTGLHSCRPIVLVLCCCINLYTVLFVLQISRLYFHSVILHSKTFSNDRRFASHFTVFIFNTCPGAVERAGHCVKNLSCL